MKTERAIELLNRISDSQFDGPHGDERREALSMAVRALSGDGDTISRQAVMKEFSDFVRKSNNSDFAQTPTWNDAVSLVGSMPSAQPEQKWIPVSEGLPKKDGRYQVTRHDDVTNTEFIDILWYEKNTWWNRQATGDYAVTAWMPLPEPWRGEKDD